MKNQFKDVNPMTEEMYQAKFGPDPSKVDNLAESKKAVLKEIIELGGTREEWIKALIEMNRNIFADCKPIKNKSLEGEEYYKTHSLKNWFHGVRYDKLEDAIEARRNFFKIK